MFQLGQRLAIINRGRNHFTNTKTGEVVVQDLPQPQITHLTTRSTSPPFRHATRLRIPKVKRMSSRFLYQLAAA